MSKYERIYFKKTSTKCTIGDKTYSKRKVFEYIKKKTKKKCIRHKKRLRDKDGNIHYLYQIKEKDAIKNLHIILDKKDLYFSFFKELDAYSVVDDIIYTLMKFSLISSGIPLVSTYYNDAIFSIQVEKELETFEEKGITINQDEFTETLKANVNSSEEPNENSFHVPEKIDHDQILQKYNFADNNELFIEKITEVIYNNSSLQTSYEAYEQLSYEELQIIAIYIEAYASFMNENDAFFDLGRFLCTLENLRIYKDKNKLNKEHETSTAYVVTKDQTMIINTFNYPKETAWYDDNGMLYHEIDHIYRTKCQCEKNESFYYSAVLEEWSAENASASIDQYYDSYWDYNRIVHNLEFALSINTDYELGTLRDAYRNKNFPLLWSSFPYFKDEKKELIEYQKMLNYYYLTHESIQNGEEVDLDIAKEASLIHTKLFYKNLLYVNELSKNDQYSPLIYDFTVIQVFEKSMKEQWNYLKIPKEEDESKIMELILKEYKDMFIEYLKTQYTQEVIEETDQQICNYTEYRLSTISAYRFTNQEKEEFYSKMLSKANDLKNKERMGAVIIDAPYEQFTYLTKSFLYIKK